MRDYKKRNHGRSNNWCSQDGINQNYYGCSGKIKMRAHRRSKREILSDISLDPPNASIDPGTPDLTLKIIGIAIGSLIGLAIIIYCLIKFIRRNSSGSREEEEGEEEEGNFPTNPRELTINFVKHNHAIPELCTTPDTQPILDYYSSKAGLTNTSLASVNDSKNYDRKSIPVEVSENIEKSSEDDKEYVPQYYNGMEIPPLGARIIPLERQVQIANELTSSNLSPTNKRKSNRSISSILSISSRRRSSSTTNNINSNSSTTNTLSLIRETTPQNCQKEDN